MNLLTLSLLGGLGAFVGPGAGEPALAQPAAEADGAAVERPVGEVRAGGPKDHDYGPFYEPEPASDLQFPSRPRGATPFFSVGQGAFCFVEDAACKASLLAAADVAAGLNMIAGDGGFDVPLTQFRFLGGATVRPFHLARGRWHPWALGATFDWSRSSGPVAAGETDADGNLLADETRHRIDSMRIGVVNQIWLSQRKHAFHIDVSLGAVQSSVLSFPGRYWGTHAEVAFGFGGWASLYLGSDFLDQDTRVLVGIRVHAIAAAPLAALALAGYAAGGGFQRGGP